jgi:hypothetical protein
MGRSDAKECTRCHMSLALDLPAESLQAPWRPSPLRFGHQPWPHSSTSGCRWPGLAECPATNVRLTCVAELSQESH